MIGVEQWREWLERRSILMREEVKCGKYVMVGRCVGIYRKWCVAYLLEPKQPYQPWRCGVWTLREEQQNEKCQFPGLYHRD